MEKPNTEKATKEQLIKYIEHLEGVLNGVSALEQQINRTCSLMAADMEKINNGKTDDLTILSLDDNILKKLMFTIKNKDFFMGKANVDKNKGKVVEMEVLTETKEKPPENVNPFEEVSKKIKANLNGSK